MSEQFRQATAETPPSPQEQFLRESLPLQFNTQTASLRDVGLLESIFKEITPADDDLVIELQEGITGMDGRPYPLPTLEQITKHFSQEKYDKKISQGFTKLLIVPFAYPLATIRARYEQALIKHHEEGKLLDREGTLLDLNTKHPLGFWKDFDKSDETDGLIYYPKQFDKENHGGYTKQELLTSTAPEARAQAPFHGFHILLIKPDLTIPTEKVAQTTNGRKDLEAGKSSKEYLNIIQTDPQYRSEQGMTMEDSFILGLISLHETNRVLDDWQNEKDSINFNIGTFHKASDCIPGSYWYRTLRQASVNGVTQRYSSGYYGLRTAVG